MFGITDPGIYMAYLMVFLCLIFAVVFGIVNWNKGKLTDEETIETDLKWEEKEEQIKKEIT
ncbi:MAG: hypothetical protein PF541_14925 [Prolixibacteraceae bacterium]|jgi:hypothetical protein|nr:hypothetical protein [Prolixibacteraceae bacterium]